MLFTIAPYRIKLRTAGEKHADCPLIPFNRRIHQNPDTQNDVINTAAEKNSSAFSCLHNRDGKTFFCLKFHPDDKPLVIRPVPRCKRDTFFVINLRSITFLKLHIKTVIYKSDLFCHNSRNHQHHTDCRRHDTKKHTIDLYYFAGFSATAAASAFSAFSSTLEALPPR